MHMAGAVFEGSGRFAGRETCKALQAESSRFIVTIHVLFDGPIQRWVFDRLVIDASALPYAHSLDSSEADGKDAIKQILVAALKSIVEPILGLLCERTTLC
jgi:hypothetical protein